MSQLTMMDVTQYVENNIKTFHDKRIESLRKLKLADVLRRKNPYLFRAKHLLRADQLVPQIADAFVSSNEETIFGDWLEGLAIFVNEKVYSGRKSGIKGIDLEFDRDGIRYIVAIKSGPNWANSGQIEKMLDNFNKAKKTLTTSNSRLHVVFVNGCCYGQDNQPNKGTHYKYCGQQFWEFISGQPDLYTDIIVPLGHQADVRNDEFKVAYAQMLNKFIKEFANEYCDSDYNIDWNKLVKFNSAKSVGASVAIYSTEEPQI